MMGFKRSDLFTAVFFPLFPTFFSFVSLLFFFPGQVTIEFHVEKETNFIVLHTQDLNVTEKVKKKNWFCFFFLFMIFLLLLFPYVVDFFLNWGGNRSSF